MKLSPNILLYALAAVSLWQIAATNLRPALSIFNVSDGLARICTTVAYAFMCSALFYLVTIQYPAWQRRKFFMPLIRERFHLLEEELITVTGLILSENIYLTNNWDEMNNKLIALQDSKWDIMINYPYKGSSNMQSVFRALKSICLKIRQVVSEVSNVYRDQLTDNEIRYLQSILDSNVYILFEGCNEEIDKGNRGVIVSEILEIFLIIHKFSK